MLDIVVVLVKRWEVGLRMEAQMVTVLERGDLMRIADLVRGELLLRPPSLRVVVLNSQ